MLLESLHSFLVHPAKNAEEQPSISGTSIGLSGQLYEMLSDVYFRSPEECDIEIVFRPNSRGEQKNECRDCLMHYVRDPRVPTGRIVAERLQRVTTNRSGLGLLFLLKGADNAGKHWLVISRFPADQGVVAQEDATKLSVEYIERVFMKNARAYKSAIFTTASLDAPFLEGKAVDRQLRGPRDLSAYWIDEFLESELRTTGPAGTRRLAIALRDAVRTSTSIDSKQELVAASQILRGRTGRISARGVLRDLELSPEAVAEVERAFARPELMEETFIFDRAEYDKHVVYRMVELDNGAMLMAEDKKWSKVFRRDELSEGAGARFTTTGTVVDERLRKTR